MPLVAQAIAWIGALFGPIISNLFLSVTRKSSVLVLFAGLLAAGYTAFMASMTALINGVQQSVPQMVLNVWSWVMPDHLYSTFLLVVTAKIGKFVFEKYQELLHTSAKVMGND